jgi:hypothetical protein
MKAIFNQVELEVILGSRQCHFTKSKSGSNVATTNKGGNKQQSQQRIDGNDTADVHPDRIITYLHTAIHPTCRHPRRRGDDADDAIGGTSTPRRAGCRVPRGVVG